MASKIKVLGIDVDGVMTDGTVVYDQQGNRIAKSYNDRDFTAIKRFQQDGVYVTFISGCENVNKKMAAQKGIPFIYCDVHQPDQLKSTAMLKVLTERGLTWDDAAYVGDDLFDLELLEKVRYAFFPIDAIADIQQLRQRKANIRQGATVLSAHGGHGVIASLYTYAKAYQLI